MEKEDFLEQMLQSFHFLSLNNLAIYNIIPNKIQNVLLVMLNIHISIKEFLF